MGAAKASAAHDMRKLYGGEGFVSSWLCCELRQNRRHTQKSDAAFHLADGNASRDARTVDTAASKALSSPRIWLGTSGLEALERHSKPSHSTPTVTGDVEAGAKSWRL